MANESVTPSGEKVGDKPTGPEACVLWVAKRVEIQCFTSHNQVFIVGTNRSTYTHTIHGCSGFLLPFPNACSFSTGGLSLLSCCSLPCTVLLPHGPQQPPFTVPCELPFFPRLASVSPAVLCQPPLLLVSSASLHTGSLYPHGSAQLEKSTWWGVQGGVTLICVLALASVLPCAFSQQHSCLTVATSLF